MGLLREVGSDTSSLLEAEHIVGRWEGCSLRIDRRYVSARHAHLRWAQRRWEIKDLGSLNGTYLEGSRIKPGADLPLAKGSRISFGKTESVWELVDDSAPPVMVVPIHGGDPLVVSGDLLVLPSEENPIVTIYRSDGTWFLEHANQSTTPITNAQRFELEGRPWRFCCPEQVWRTAAATGPRALELRNLRLVFSVSRDEEFVELRATCGDTVIPLGARTFNYLLLTLARRRMADAKDGVAEGASGWICYEDFENDPSMAPPQIAINVYRLRRLFAAAGIAGAADIVERRPRTRQLRIGISDVAVECI
jgi:hypothetical protein